MNKVFFFETVNECPHLETSLELALRHLDEGDTVTYYFLGHAVPYADFCSSLALPKSIAKRFLPEECAARLVRHPNFEFISVPHILCSDLGPLPRFTLTSLKSFKYKGFDLGMGVASSLISRSRNSGFSPEADRGLVNAALKSGAAIFDFVIEVLNTGEPNLVYLFNGRFVNTRAVLRACQVLNVKYRIHERGADKSRFSVRNYLPHDRLKFQGEMLEFWSHAESVKVAKELAGEWFMKRRAGKETGWKSYTVRQEKSRVPQLDTDAKIITYFSSSDDEYEAIGDEYKWDGWRNQRDAVMQLISMAENLKEYQFLIRIHPHLSEKHPKDLEWWQGLQEQASWVTVISSGDPVDTYALIEASDIVITAGSTVGIEAVFWGTPSILLGPSMYDKLGAVYRARSSNELINLLSRNDLFAEAEKALPYGYYFSVFGEVFKHYEPQTLFSGRFLGVDLHQPPLPIKIWNKIGKLAKPRPSASPVHRSRVG